MKAYCWKSGLIELGQRVPSGAIEIATGPAKPLREMIEVVSRHAYDGKSLLVPGVPEADNKDAAVDALIAFKDWIKPRVVNLRRAA